MARRRPRVLVLNHFAVPRGQAGGTRHVELFGLLRDWDHLIIASDFNGLSGDRVAAQSGLSVVAVPAFEANDWRRVLNWFAYARRAALLGLRQRHVDVVYGSSPHLLAALAAWIIASVKRVPFVMEVRDLWPKVLSDMGQLDPSSLTYRLLTSLETFLYRRAAAIVVMAEGSLDELRQRGISPAKLHFVPNGADPEDYVPTSGRDELRERFGFNGVTAVYVGAHGPANGLDLLLDAAAEVADLPLEIVLVGGGVEKPSLRARATALGLTNVRFCDPISKSSVPDLLAAADVGLHVLADVELFRSAVSPNKVFDYMAAGLPFITNSPGLVGDLVSVSGGGVSVAPRGLADGLRSWYDNRSLAPLSDAGDRGRNWLINNQSRTAMADRLSRVLAACTDPGGIIQEEELER